jgi:hypothetical protein
VHHHHINETCHLFQERHHHINETCNLTLYSLYSNNSHFSLNISTMARFKPVGKKRTKAKAPAKQGQDNRRSHCIFFAAAAAAAATAATAAAAAPVAAPANDAGVPPAGSLGTDSPSGIIAPSATAATTAVIAAATLSVAGADTPDFAAVTRSAAAGVPLLPKKCSLKVKKPAKGSAPSAIKATAVSVAAASSTANVSHSAPPTF